MKSDVKLLLLLGFMSFFANGDSYAASVLMGDMARDLDISASQASMSVTSYALAFGVFTLLFGPMSDRFGKAIIINVAGFGTAIFSIFAAFSFDLNSLMFFRAINGAFGAGILPVSMSFIGDRYSGTERQKALGNLMGLSFVGAATATLIGGTIAFVGSWRLVYIIYGILEFCLSCILYKNLERDIPKIHQLNLIKIYSNALKNHAILPIMLVIFFVGFSMRGSFTFTGLLVTELTGFNIFIVGVMLSIFGVGTLAGAKIVPILRVRVKNYFLLLAGIIGFFAFLLLSHTHNAFLVCLCLFMFGVIFITMQSSFVDAAQTRSPEMKGTTMSLTSFCMFTGTGVGTCAYGVLMDAYGVYTVFICAACILLFLGFIANKIVLKK